jgi:hypothetical protein
MLICSTPFLILLFANCGNNWPVLSDFNFRVMRRAQCVAATPADLYPLTTRIAPQLSSCMESMREDRSACLILLHEIPNLEGGDMHSDHVPWCTEDTGDAY